MCATFNRIDPVEPFTTIAGVAAPLPRENIDTDVIMPKQFLKGITRNDLARGLFYDLRFDASGREREDFILNQPPYRQPSFLIVGPNFGCGSSREHAVWGLAQFGIRGILGTSFASIFQDNCFRNGLLPVALRAEQYDRILKLCSDPGHNRLSIDLRSQLVTLADGTPIPFSVDEMRRGDLLNGRDPIASTLRFAEDILAFERDHWSAQPWLKPPAAPS
jgi:3-isopropylmalate/(R)-2-methylmalate dehydratase small subunit